MRIAMSRKQWIIFASIVVVLVVGALYCTRADAAERARPLLGGGFGYDDNHEWAKALFTGVQFPRDRYGNNWQLQIGPSWYEREAMSGTVTTGGCSGGHLVATCRPTTLPWTAPGGTVRVFSATVVVVFK